MRLRDARVLAVPTVLLPAFARAKSTRKSGNAPIWRGRIKWQIFIHVVVDAMLKTGFTPDEIGKIGGAHYLRIFSESVKR